MVFVWAGDVSSVIVQVDPASGIAVLTAGALLSIPRVSEIPSSTSATIINPMISDNVFFFMCYLHFFSIIPKPPNIVHASLLPRQRALCIMKQQSMKETML